MEAVERRYVKALKDLGGGLSCCLSELSDTLGKGFDIELSKIHSKEKVLIQPALWYLNHRNGCYLLLI